MSARIWSIRKAPNGFFSQAQRTHWRHWKRRVYVKGCTFCCGHGGHR